MPTRTKRLSHESLESRRCLTAVAFSPHELIASEINGASDAYAADIDGDGDLDMLSASYVDGKTAWYPNIDGKGTFGPQQVIFAEPPDEVEPALGPLDFVYPSDIDGDGDVDVVSNNHSGGTVSWFENLDGSGTFGSRHEIGTEELLRFRMTADFDNDGDQDVLTSLGWYENTDGLGTFGPLNSTVTPGFDDISTFAADMDNDGDLDFISGGVNYVAYYENTDGHGTFAPPVKINQGGLLGVFGLHAADFDGDGDLDVLSASIFHNTFWLENEGDGTFQNQHEIVGRGATSLFAADFDGDEDVDVLTPFGWLENNGSGVFGELQPIGTGWSVHAADIDSDGDMDVVSALGANDSVAWFDNSDGYGSFGIAQTVGSPGASRAEDIEAADIDGDGDLDILSAARYGNDKTAWFENLDGNGTFSSRKFIANEGGRRVSAHDFDGDGDLDLLTAASYGSLVWHENTNGQGEFAERDRIAVRSNVSHAADIDGDGDLDALSQDALLISGHSERCLV